MVYTDSSVTSSSSKSDVEGCDPGSTELYPNGYAGHTSERGATRSRGARAYVRNRKRVEAPLQTKPWAASSSAAAADR